MSAAPTEPTTGQETTEGAGPAQSRDERINVLAETLYAQKQIANNKKAHADRVGIRQLWNDARREAISEIRRADTKAKAKETARAAATTAKGQGKSVLHRNRAQLAPWLLSAPYAACGTAAGVAAEQAAANPVAISALVAASSIGGSILAWRKKVAARVPARFRQKATAGMGLGCCWASAAPLVDSPAGMALAAVAGTGWMGLSWWRQHDHPIPLPAEHEPAPEPAEADTTSDSLSARQVRIRGVLAAWESKVARKGQAVPGSSIEFCSATDSVDQYRITLDDAGQVTRNQLAALAERIGMALGIMEDRISFEKTGHPAQVILKHLVTDPVFHYQGPVVLCDGQPIHSRWEVTPGSDVDIVFGTYLDGQEYVTYRVIEQGSVNSAFLLGGMGSGKTKTAEIIAVGLRMLGCYILWIDGQSGASSPLLNEYANEVFGFNMDDRDDDSGVSEFTAAVSAFAKKRNQDLQDQPELGGEYTYDPHRPPFIGMMDEAHEIFQTKHPTEKTYARRLEAFAVQLRKLGGGFVALSQDYDKTSTFGDSSRLRDALVTSGNLVAMRQMDKSRIGMLPTGSPRLDTVPGRGYGYMPLRHRPDALWITQDLGGTKEQALGTLRAWMSHYEAGVLEFTLDSTPVAATPASPDSGSGGDAAVVHFPGATPASPEPDPVDPDAASLSTTEQQCLVIVQGEPQTKSTLARTRGVSPPAAGKVLDRLAAKGFVVKMEDGRYMAKI